MLDATRNLNATRNLDTQGQLVAPHTTTQARDSVDLPALFWILRKDLWIIIASVGLSAAIGAGYVVTTPTTFVASTQVLIEPQRPQLFWQEPGMLDLTIDNAQVESQVEILRSDRISTSEIAGSDHPPGIWPPPDPQRRGRGPRRDRWADPAFGHTGLVRQGHSDRNSRPKVIRLGPVCGHPGRRLQRRSGRLVPPRFAWLAHAQFAGFPR